MDDRDDKTRIYKALEIRDSSIAADMIVLGFGEKLLVFLTGQVDCVVNVSHEKINDIPSMFKPYDLEE